MVGVPLHQRGSNTEQVQLVPASTPEITSLVVAVSKFTGAWAGMPA